VFSHIRTRHAFTHTYTLQTEDSYHSEDHPIFTPGESTREARYISKVKPSEDREKVLGRTKCPRSFGQMLPLVLGLNAIQVHTHTHRENHYANEGSALVEKCSVIPQYVSKWRPLYRPETSTGSSEGNCSRFRINTR